MRLEQRILIALAFLVLLPLAMGAGYGRGGYSTGGVPADLEVDTVTATGLITASQVEITSGGSSVSPAFQMDTDANTGIYFPGADQIGLAAGGTGAIECYNLSNDYCYMGAGFQLVVANNGGYTNPGLALRSSDLDNGIDYAETDQWDLIAGGVAMMTMDEDTTDQVVIPSGVALQVDDTNGAQITGIYTANLTINFPNIGTHGYNTQTGTVTGAAVGDICIVTRAGYQPGFALSCDISAADTARIHYVNNTNTGADPVNDTYRVIAIGVR